jgi:hypothetical protein
MPQASPEIALTSTELYLLDHLVADKSGSVPPNNTLSLYLTKLTRLGGYLARAKDPPPGNTVMWRGLTRLTDIQLGFILGTELVGNLKACLGRVYIVLFGDDVWMVHVELSGGLG